ncbi:hypothetical protein Micbo1qcDRAFT_226264 [Microdochium bolleyi]|uniref:Uncharacterized protein n=1 Tax=Microdochium bolleyi TaxID=196109 RepID=A0A136IZH9_9PEZI|nr:hypothetical protein Micbo1qcDRAFT_226264 [Microdochium bolleyi]
MRTLLFSAVLLLASPARAALNGRCTGDVGNPHKLFGICVATSTCKKYKGTTVNDGCPNDGDDIKCCWISSCYDGRSSHCQWTSQKCEGGVFVPDQCPGNSNYKCCDYLE